MERTVKKGAVAFRRWAASGGLNRGQSASLLTISPDTLGHWERSWARERLPMRPRGRPPRRLGRAERRQVLSALREIGPPVGVPTLQGMFPEAARREIADLAGRYRMRYVRTHPIVVFLMRWWRVGAVWAMDYTEPPLPVDGLYPHILSVRDLASGYHLLSLPTRVTTAEVTCDALRLLFAAHGEPLVLKSDNDGALDGQVVQRLLCEHGVSPLLSPRYVPQYNGACEGGIGAVKTCIHHVAARGGHPDRWTSDDVEAARILCNHTVRPYAGGMSTPAAQWRAWAPIAPAVRDAFAESVEHYHAQHLADDERPDNTQKAAQRPAQHQAALRRRAHDQDGAPAARRQAVRRALVAHGFLSLERRRITLPLNSVFRGKIT